MIHRLTLFIFRLFGSQPEPGLVPRDVPAGAVGQVGVEVERPDGQSHFALVGLGVRDQGQAPRGNRNAAWKAEAAVGRALLEGRQHPGLLQPQARHGHRPSNQGAWRPQEMNVLLLVY